MGCKDGGCTCGDETPVIETESPCEEAEPEIIYIISTPSLPCDDVCSQSPTSKVITTVIDGRTVTETVSVTPTPSVTTIPVPSSSGCSTGFYPDKKGSCVPVVVTNPNPPSCPSGYQTDGFGNCLPPQTSV